MIIGSVVSEEDDKILGRTDGWTDGRSDCTPRPAFAFGDAGKNHFVRKVKKKEFEKGYKVIQTIFQEIFKLPSIRH